uniref:Uncharacterized protein n=1 Tax=Anguilla anguilla TaxID=7936 RepID=A0A0E9WUX7_ANGAN
MKCLSVNVHVVNNGNGGPVLDHSNRPPFSNTVINEQMKCQYL